MVKWRKYYHWDKDGLADVSAKFANLYQARLDEIAAEKPDPVFDHCRAVERDKITEFLKTLKAPSAPDAGHK
jgi:hypothetical protein